MKAVVKYANGAKMVELQEMLEPQAGPGDLLIEIKAAGICGSDLLAYGGESYAVQVPIILGHECAGVVVAVGEGANGFVVGDRVVTETSAVVCGECVYCRTGEYNRCPRRTVLGSSAHGAFAPYMAVRAAICHHLPATISFEDGVLVEPLCVAFHALVEKSRLKPDDTVVVMGPGPIGLLAIQVAHLAGAGKVVLVGKARHRERLALGLKLGADLAVASDEQDPAAALRALGDGFGAHLILDTAGASETIRQAVELVRPSGQITRLGLGGSAAFDLDLLTRKAACLQGSSGHTYPTWERALDLVAAGRIEVHSLIGGVYPLARWQDAFEDADAGKLIKALLVP